jgi:hypothetical protein
MVTQNGNLPLSKKNNDIKILKGSILQHEFEKMKILLEFSATSLHDVARTQQRQSVCTSPQGL